MKNLFLKQIEINDGHWSEMYKLYDDDYNGVNGENKAIQRIQNILDKYKDDPLSDDEYMELIFDDIEECLGTFASRFACDCSFNEGIYTISIAYIY